MIADGEEIARFTKETLPVGAPFPVTLMPLCDAGDPWASAWNNGALAAAMDEKLGPLKDCVYDEGSRVCRRCGQENYLLKNEEYRLRWEKAERILGTAIWCAMNGAPMPRSELALLDAEERRVLTARVWIHWDSHGPTRKRRPSA